MYTLEMSSAFRAIVPPQDFGVVIIDNEEFLTVQIDPEQLLGLDESQKAEAVKYVKDVKQALEDNGAIVLLVREALEN
ncbi:hypothetical protein UFOVP222_80 [uncultured Caudovirales phage]|uniref:Uncharacterized protein n=1 Tax=uncultured Caudovirales phage TaxID=2100421 RepID=A0A6J7WRX7_9CAUD|nr:hypothetical protein UFOVP108_75 [uncultured Caudovirales phage]CAB5219502.1 hypothetical protein UFOVP222_80 [uncultured Caudovirales phage]